MTSYLKKNLLSFVIGCLIGLPISLYAVREQPTYVYYESVEGEQIYEEKAIEVVRLNEDKLNVNFQVYEMTEEELAEEAYHDSLELLALCVEAEAGNQGLLGKKYVADVILNRVDDEEFPDNITDVIMQKNQFSVVSDGRIWEAEPTEETFQAVREELEYRTNYEVLYFTSEGFHPCGQDWKKIDDHYFSVKKEG